MDASGSSDNFISLKAQRWRKTKKILSLGNYSLHPLAFCNITTADNFWTMSIQSCFQTSVEDAAIKLGARTWKAFDGQK
ncbi:hypothetical protein scyTo_0000940 [Scyliorhinus torazame]|uniref:Uncharacterized protein n=1 Tax=Scyliorhinus torazame TaxID=75743 RepID=A0A401P6J7_SCYTO|nr:hypothetical protein [Scyliorhinus torazame]